MQDSLLAVLRRATAGQHAQIEQLLRLDKPFALKRYTAVVQGFESFLRQWEPQVEQALPQELQAWFRERRRGAMARADLRALGADPLEGEVALPMLGDPFQALGSMYVLEGSALGGQVIARQVERQHGITRDTGASYFGGRGARTAPMWREFQQVLADHDEPARRESAGEAAVGTFQALIGLFAKVPHAA